MSASVKALVFFSFRNHKKGYIEKLFARLKDVASKHGPLHLSRGSLSDLHISTTDSKLSIKEALTGNSLSDFDVIYFELWQKAPQQALTAALYADRHSIAFLSREPKSLPALGKVAQLGCLSDSSIVAVPDSFASSNRELRKVFETNAPFEYPVIVKSIDGFGGRDNFLVSSYEDLCKVLDGHKKDSFIIQAYVPNDCDYRCLVFGGEIKLIIKRSRRSDSGTHLNNTSHGATTELIAVDSLPQLAQDMILEAARLTNRLEFAGVDLVIDKITGQPYILEVNESPEIEVGAVPDKKTKALLDYMVLLSEGRKI